MTPTDHLRRVAGALAGSLRGLPGPPVVLLGGSAATGRVDAASDLDLLVITPEPVPAERRHGWLRGVVDPGSALYLDQPLRTGGLADTGRVGGVDATIAWRTGPAVEAELQALRTGARLEREHETTYGHELLQALVLHDPLRLTAAWRTALLPYPPLRRERVLAALAPAFTPVDDELAACRRLYPAAAALFHAWCARQGRYYPGPKRVAQVVAGEPEGEALAAALRALERAEPAARRLPGLCALGRRWTGPTGAAPASAAPGPEPAPLSLLNAGADATGGRMLVAARRGDVLSFAHYAHRSLDAYLRLGGEPAPVLAAWRMGFAPAAMPTVQRRLADCWQPLMTTLAGRGDLDTRYAEAALDTARRGAVRG